MFAARVAVMTRFLVNLSHIFKSNQEETFFFHLFAIDLQHMYILIVFNRIVV